MINWQWCLRTKLHALNVIYCAMPGLGGKVKKLIQSSRLTMWC